VTGARWRLDSKLPAWQPSAYGDDVLVDHHEREPTVALERMTIMEVHDHWRSQSSIQKSRGTRALCSFAFPYRSFQAKVLEKSRSS